MRLLLNDELAPITSEIGFIEADVDAVLAAFIRWQSLVMEPLGIHVNERPIAGSLRDVFLKLLPLTGPRARRYLFVPTASPWVSFFDNSSAGTDAFSVPSYLATQLSCRALRITAVPHTAQGNGNRGRYGACVLEIFGPGGGPQGHLRSITLVNDGGRWVFEQYGKSLAFEHAEKYNRAKVRERFTFEDLRDYLVALGLRPFDEDFYYPEAARLVELTGPRPKGMKEYSLEEVRDTF